MKNITIYTDGACSGNPGPGGWAAILQWNSHQKEISGHEFQTTNNRMELTAIIEGLKALKEPCSVTVYTDSQYVIGVMSGWKRKANHDLLAQLDALCAEHSVTFQHTRGHAGHPLNERADELAVMEREKARSMPDRIDFTALSDGRVVILKLRRDTSDIHPHDIPIPGTYSIEPATFDLDEALAPCQANGYVIHRWDGGARAWLGNPRPIRTASQIQAMRAKNPYSQLDFAYDG